MHANTLLFRDRYTLARLIDQKPDYELWEGHDTFGGPVLIKAWAFGSDSPAEAERALWNAELRHLFRLASLPESDEHLVVLRDAGIDWTHKCFAMVMLAPGLALLETAVADPSKYAWLRNRKDLGIRAEIWRGIRRLALGLIQLHEQQMFHRALSANSVLVDPERGPSTFRLGGFEWTVKLGEDLQVGSPGAPVTAGTYSFESDWFMFGWLMGRLVAGMDQAQDSNEIARIIGERQHLNGEEQDLLEALLTQDPNARLGQGDEIIRRIDSIITALDEPRRLGADDYLGLVVLLGPQRPLTLAIIELEEKISALELEAQRKFIEMDLRNPRIIRSDGGNRETYTLVGNRLRYLITEHVRDEASPRGAWDLAYCRLPTELRYSTGEDDQIELRRVSIRVFTLRALATDENVVRKGAISWKSFLPRRTSKGIERDSIQRIHDFFRITNQIELLMRDAEIFAYSTIERRFVDGAEEVRLREIQRKRAIPEFAHSIRGLADFLQTEEEARDGNLVYLGEEDSLDLDKDVPPEEFWEVTNINVDNGVVTLRRPRRKQQEPPPQEGYLRARGLFGQMSLIKRRKRAIDRLGTHAYLLRAIQSPDFTFVDTSELLPRIINPNVIDEAKRSAMQSIWRTRPIFALQGPPGTGKTTLVASLLSQVFDDDPLAQVLVTAQAHAAVEVLRDKVRAEFVDIPNPPLAVRLQRTKGDTSQDPDYVEQVAKGVLAKAVLELGRIDRKPLQSRWLEAAQGLLHALTRGDTEGHSRDFCELVKRAAGITYCTTTSANLEALADSTQTFDWSIVEEAGKAHGFDLALPLRAGHRWLLIGDQKQLWPYRYEDFRSGLLRLDETFDAIQGLPKRGGGQVDLDLVLRWNKYDSGERASRRELWLRWLPFFETVHATCSRVRLPSDADGSESGGPVLATMLSRQHRMHPTIAGLVSAAYYGAGIQSETVDKSGLPLPRVVHAFHKPAGLYGRAILWVDVPWVGSSEGNESLSESLDGRYTSDYEVRIVSALLRLLSSQAPEAQEPMDLAILSPYRKQVAKLQKGLHDVELPTWLKPALSNQTRDNRRIVATVDSFQGNQADIVIISLVRNNQLAPGMGLGFLREARRMNVLFSRAERLLVLVGSWEFFQQQLRDVPPDDTQPLGHWRLALNYIDSCLQSGRALRIDARSLGEGL